MIVLVIDHSIAEMFITRTTDSKRKPFKSPEKPFTISEIIIKYVIISLVTFTLVDRNNNIAILKDFDATVLLEEA